MAAVTLITPAMELHLSGCADIARTIRKGWSKATKTQAQYAKVSKGASLVEALIEADTDMADMFCEEPYTEASREAGCWSTQTCHVAPCLASAIKAAGITFDPETGRPQG